MAVKLREYPALSGLDAQKFLQRQEQHKKNLQKRAEAKLASQRRGNA